MPSLPRWETFAESAQGVNKRLNQDCWAAEGTGTAEEPLILAVADGHGSAQHARSDVGAGYAVEQFAAHAREFADRSQAADPGGARTLSRLMRYAQHEMPRQLVAGWQHDVQKHYDRQRRDEQQRRDDRQPPEAGGEPTSAQKLLLYGATLVGAVLTPDLFAAWQLGDGELVIVEEDGAVARPLAPAEADLGDETESLCSREAWRLMRVHWAPVTDPSRTPRLISLSTDGLSKSFASDEGFIQFVTGLSGRLTAEGTDAVRAVLPEWLAKAAQHSGDDTTLAAGRRHGSDS